MKIAKSKEIYTLKTKILSSALAISILANIAGIVFFILYLNQIQKNKSVKREKIALERNLNIVKSAESINKALNADKVQKRTFVSKKDGQIDFYAFQAPEYRAGALDYVLVVYLHGMGSNYMEPFTTPNPLSIAETLTRDFHQVGILSCNYRKEASWGNDNATADIFQNIEEILEEYPFEKIVLMGTSMGGCVALNLATLAPKNIEDKLLGVVSMESSGNLIELYRNTKSRDIRPAMIMAFGGSPEQVPHIYQSKSFTYNIYKAKKDLKFFLLSAKNDRVVPSNLQNSLYELLIKEGLKAKLEQIEGDHQTPESKHYWQGLDFVLRP